MGNHIPKPNFLPMAPPTVLPHWGVPLVPPIPAGDVIPGYHQLNKLENDRPTPKLLLLMGIPCKFVIVCRRYTSFSDAPKVLILIHIVG